MKSPYEVISLPALEDNYIHLIHHLPTHEVLAIDPSQAEPVQAYIESRGLRLSLILNTHHHWDHTGGNQHLKNWARCPVWCSSYDFANARVPAADRGLENGPFDWQGLKLQAIAVPGHTLGHMAYFSFEHHWLFSGDTLFLMGCGRLFEGTAQQLLESLDHLAALPEETLIYCGHNYIEKNGRFALAIEPENQDVRKRNAEIAQAVSENRPIQPGSLALEKKTNPFLRVQGSPAERLAAFTGLRLKRNSF